MWAKGARRESRQSEAQRNSKTKAGKMAAPHVLSTRAAQTPTGASGWQGDYSTSLEPLAQLPGVHPQCAVALRVTFMSGEEGSRKLNLNFVNADGRSIMPPIEMPIAVALPDDAHFVTRNFVVNFQGLTFAEAGLYSVDVRLDDKSQASIPLSVKVIQRPAA